jgi:ubiquinone/menaquinone biosynthesis C-methylase UbiE
MTSDPARLFTERAESYTRFIEAVLYPQGIRAYFRAASFLRSGLRVLDAGCGTGVVTLGLHDALVRRGFAPGDMHGFDLTGAMLDRFRKRLLDRGMTVELAQADVLRLDDLPAGWSEYNLVVSASMLEYVPRDQFALALAGLRRLLRDDGLFILFITRRNWLTRPLIGHWWASNLYSAAEVLDALSTAGFQGATLANFPLPFQREIPATSNGSLFLRAPVRPARCSE